MNESDTPEKMPYMGEEFLKERKYWLDQLSGELTITRFPYDNEPGDADESRFDHINLTFDGKIFSRLMQLRNNSDFRLHMIMTAVTAILINRYTGADDIIIGTTIDKQESEEVYLNTILPLRNRIHGDMTFKQFLLRTRQTVSGAIENQNYPWEELFSQLQLKPGETSTALFDVAVLLENIQDKKYLRHIRPSVLFYFARTDEDINVTVEYRSSLYRKDSIERILTHFARLLEIAIFNIDIELSSMDILTPEEKKEPVEAFNRSSTASPGKKTVVELFEEQAAKIPGAAALIFGSNEVSYRELKEKSDRLAQWLTQQGAGPDTIVGIMIEQSIEMVVGIFGILKTGGAYLPIDPDYPEERKRYILADSGAKILLTADLIIKAAQLTQPAQPAQPSRTGGFPQPRHLAYVIYTSGSTGNPKGVMIEHGSLVNYIHWAARQYVKNEKVNFALYTSFAFDLTVTSIFTPLITGNTIYIYRGEKEFLLEKVFEENKVEAVKLTPAHLMVVSGMEVHESKIRRLIVGGEKLETQLALRMHDNSHGKFEIYNEYGPTEAAVGCMIYRFDPQKDRKASVPIGIPAANVRVYVLDRYRARVPGGGIGELYIAGDGLARGYLNNPQLTNDKFIRCPFQPGKKMYKTGDTALRLTDGNLEFLGREDRQVKIRGYRIETREVENCLLKYERIAHAVVLAWEDENGYKCLVAYILPEETGGRIEAAELREFLSGYLPEFMIPSYFVQVESLPLTINGKVDRRALPEPDLKSMVSAGEYKAPGNEVEQVLAKTWEEVLNVPRVGVTDNYFDLGGDSIKAIMLSSRLLDFHHQVSIADIFSNPSIERLAKFVKKTDRVIDQGLVEGEVELTPIQHWLFHEFHEPENPDNIRYFNQSVMLHNKDGFDETIVGKVFEKIVEHHDALRMLYKIEGSRVTQRNRGMEGKLFELDIFHWENEENVEENIIQEAKRLQRGVDLNEGPLVKLGLFKTSAGSRLFIVIHHLVMDAVSGRILLEDFESGYRQVEKGEEIKFPQKTDSFKTWAYRLKDYSVGASILSEMEYWKQIKETGVTKLPSDSRDGGAGNVRMWKDMRPVSITLDENETEALLKKTNKAYNTEVNDLLLTAFCLAAYDWAAMDRVLIQLEGHGREEILPGINISRTLGWYTSLYPVLFDLTAAGITGNGGDAAQTHDKHTSQSIKLVKDTLRRVPNKGVGYGILKYLTPDEKKDKLSFSIEPEIGFNYLGQFDRAVSGQMDRNLFELSPISEEYNISLELKSLYKLEIRGSVIDETLTLEILYSQCEYESGSIQKLANYYKSNLLKIIQHCVDKEESEVTLSDLTSSDVDMEEMSNIMDVLEDEFRQ